MVECEGAFERYTTLIESLEKEAGGRVDLLASVSTEVIGNMLDALPIELSFVDENDRVRYFNKLDKEKIFVRSLSVIGRTVQQCHPPKSVHMVNQILKDIRWRQSRLPVLAHDARPDHARLYKSQLH